MIIIGITGAIGHGKTSLGNSLQHAEPSSKHMESSNVIIEVANALRASQTPHPAPKDLKAINVWLAQLPAILKRVTHSQVPSGSFIITKPDLAQHTDVYQKLFEYLKFIEDWPGFASGIIRQDNKSHYRSLLQWLGGYCNKKLSPSIWFDELIRRSRKERDLQLVTIGGVRFPSDADCIKVAGGLILTVERPATASADSNDVTERERQDILPDIRIYNDGSLDQLQLLATKLYQDIDSGKPKKQYRASKF